VRVCQVVAVLAKRNTTYYNFRVRRASEEGFDGIAYMDLEIEAVDWEHRAEHIRRRSERKGHGEEPNIEPEWATEAAMDPNRLVGDSGSESGSSVRVVGYSQAARMTLTVLLVPKTSPAGADWWGASAWAADPSDCQAYDENLRGKSK
jgi:hypothetical protein